MNSKKVVIVMRRKCCGNFINFVEFQIILSVLALCSLAACDENRTVSETRIIPIATANFPHTHERIMVPVDPDPVQAVEIIEKPVREKSQETNLRKRHNHYEKEHVEVPAKQMRRNPKNFDDGKGNYHKASSYNSRSDNPRSVKDANNIKPLNINTKVFKKTPAAENQSPPTGKYQSRIRVQHPEQVHEIKNMVKDSRHKLKKENLPQNPEEVPTTSWFDNTGKYNYGIVHDFKEPEVYKDSRSKVAQQVEEVSKQIRGPQVFKSSFRDPKASAAQVEHKANGPNLGNFLYKSEVFYPSYRDNLYPPVITYGDAGHDLRPATKELPATNLHKTPVEDETEKPRKHTKPTRRPAKKQEKHEKNQKQQDEEEYDDDDGDYEDPGNNDKYSGEAPGDDDEASDGNKEEGEGDEEGGDEESDDRDYSGSEEEGDGKSDDDSGEDSPQSRSSFTRLPSYKYSFDADGSHNSGSAESDEFERSWAKYGYGPKSRKDSDDDDEEGDEASYESSETQIKPHRIKFHYEKKEEITTPHVQSTTKPSAPKKKLTRAMSGSLHNHKPKASPKKTDGISPVTESNLEKTPKSVGSQKSQPADDLKYFQ
jgi:hypothetical protein